MNTGLPCEDDPDTWFTVSEVETRSNLDQIAKAKAGCDVCPIKPGCLEQALNLGVEYGVWGGLTSTERRQLVGITKDKKRGRGIMRRYVEEYKKKGN